MGAIIIAVLGGESMDELKAMISSLQTTMQESMNTMQEGMNKMQNDMKKMQSDMNKMQNTINKMQKGMNSMQKDIKTMQTDIVNLKHGQEALEKLMISKYDELKQEIREVNGRLAVFQEEMTRKVNVLFDADLTRQEHLESYDKELARLMEKTDNHSIRIEILEAKTRSA